MFLRAEPRNEDGTMTNIIIRTVRPIHFENFGGQDFERLLFTYHLRAG